MKRLLVGITLVLIGGLFFSGLASAKEPVEVKVTLSEFKVEMSSSDLPAGTVVRYVITNTGKLQHETVLEKDGAVDEPLEFNGTGQEAEDIDPGTTRTVEWTIPESGKYQLACHVAGHFESGMRTTFTAAAAQPAAAPAAQPAAAPAAQPAAAPAQQLPKTGGEDYMWLAAIGLLALLAVVGGVALRYRKAE